MVNFFKPAIANNLVACLTAVAFTAAVIKPPSCHAKEANLDIGAINFGIKIEKIFEKIKKCIDRGETNKIVSYMFDIKSEVEQYTGKMIDINTTIDQVQKEASAKGQKIDDKYIKLIKNDFGKQDKKHKHRGVWFAQCAELDIPYSTMEADLQFDNMMDKSAQRKDDKQEEVPVKIVVGVTVSLCGLFLIFVPLPGCNAAGGWLLNTGIGILGSDALDRWEAYDKENRNKDK